MLYWQGAVLARRWTGGAVSASGLVAVKQHRGTQRLFDRYTIARGKCSGNRSMYYLKKRGLKKRGLINRGLINCGRIICGELCG